MSENRAKIGDFAPLWPKISGRRGRPPPIIFQRTWTHVRYMSLSVLLSSVCLSVCLSSVTFVHPTQAIEIFGMFLCRLVPWPSGTFR